MASNIIKEFIIALDQEIVAIKKGKGGSIVKVFNGRFLREMSGFFVYLFNLENFLSVLDDSPADIEIRGNRYPAQVLLTQGLEVEIGIEKFCGNYIADAKLQTNLWYLLELLKKKFAELENRTNDGLNLSEAFFNSQLGKGTGFENIVTCRTCGIKNRIGNHAPNQIPICGKCKKPIQPYYSSSAKPPNEPQKRAIEASFFSQLAVIWGPPGTGKTKTIAQAIEAHLNAGRRVLLVSHANAAVDEALIDVAEQLKITPFYNEGKIVRLGIPNPGHLEKLTERCPLVLLDNIAAKLGVTLSVEKNNLEVEKSHIDSILVKYETAIHAIQTVKTLSSELNAFRLELSDLNSKLFVYKNELKLLAEEQINNRIKLTKAQSSGTLKRLFSGLDPNTIQREIDKSSILIDSKKRIAKELTDRICLCNNLLSTKEEETDRAKIEADKLLNGLRISIAEIENKMKEFSSRKDVIFARLAGINQKLDEISKGILLEARLIATTLTKTFVAKQFPDTPFDVLILDEASMAPLPQLYWAISRCRGQITIVGDFLQLPPICISEEGMARKWLGNSIYSVLSINGVTEADRDQRITLLDTQYRMAPEISIISNRFFYQNKLKDHPSTSNRRWDDGISQSPLVLIDTESINPWCSKLATGGRFNLYNALVCCTLAKKIIPKISEGRIGIITPYKVQARLISKIAKDWDILDHIHTNTVHSFQGGEESIIIFDTVEGSGTKVAPMLDDKYPDSDAKLLLNVAITRAKNRLYLVGHTKRLLSDLHADSVLSRIIQHFYENAEMITPDLLVDNYFANDFERWSNVLMSSMTNNAPVYGDLYTERNFWAKFAKDLIESKTRLIILSPFLSVRRSDFFMNYFRAMKGRGIDIRIYTRPKNQQTGEMVNQADIVINQLRSIGVNVIERRSMHQKVAIVDDSIAWEGSLNILSHKDTEEQMRRFEGLSTVEEIIRNLELDEDMPSGNQTREKCPKPGCDGYLVVRSKFGKKFLGCSNYAKNKCTYTKQI